MKKLLTIALAFTVIGLAGCKKESETNKFYYDENKEYVSYEYVITDKDDKSFTGDSIIDETGINFDNKNVRTNTDINIGDTVVAIFEKNNVGDGLIEVVKK